MNDMREINLEQCEILDRDDHPVEWEISGLPRKVFDAWRTALEKSGAVDDGQAVMRDDGTAAGLSQMVAFRHILGNLSKAMAGVPGACAVIEARPIFIDPDGKLIEKDTGSASWVVGEKGFEPLRVKSGENPYLAMRNAIEKACGSFVARNLEEAAARKR